MIADAQYFILKISKNGCLISEKEIVLKSVFEIDTSARKTKSILEGVEGDKTLL